MGCCCRIRHQRNRQAEDHPGFQYYSGYGLVSFDKFSNNDAWKAGLTVDYKITDGLPAKVAANYLDVDTAFRSLTGFCCLQRAF